MSCCCNTGYVTGPVCTFVNNSELTWALGCDLEIFNIPQPVTDNKSKASPAKKNPATKKYPPVRGLIVGRGS